MRLPAAKNLHIFGLSRLGALGSLCPECPNSGHQSLGSIRPSQSARQSIGTGCRPFRTRASGRSTRRFWRRQASRHPQKIEGDNRREVGRPLDVLGTSPLWACAGEGRGQTATQTCNRPAPVERLYQGLDICTSASKEVVSLPNRSSSSRRLAPRLADLGAAYGLRPPIVPVVLPKVSV